MYPYAFTDPRRREEDIIYPDKVTMDKKDSRFYCPNPACDAHMYLCSATFKDSSVRPYFRATRKDFSHVKNCYCTRVSFPKDNFTENLFDFDKATERAMLPVIHGDGEAKEPKKKHHSPRKTPPHTIRQIYNLAKTHPVTQTYHDTKIWYLLADERSQKMYQNGILHSCLVECRFGGYEKEYRRIKMRYYVSDTRYFTLLLNFKEKETMKEYLDILIPNKSSPAVVWGEWKRAGPAFECEIHSLKQFFIPELE